MLETKDDTDTVKQIDSSVDALQKSLTSSQIESDNFFAWQLQAQEYKRVYQVVMPSSFLLFQESPSRSYQFQSAQTEVVSFILKQTAGDGDCFFHAVGKKFFTREALVQKLLENSTETVRRIFGYEIRQFLYLGDSIPYPNNRENEACQRLLTSNIKSLFSILQDAEEKLRIKVGEVRLALGQKKTHEKHPPALLALLSEKSSPSASEFEQTYQAVLSADKAIYEYCCQTDVFESYVELYLKKACGYIPFSRDFSGKRYATTIDAINELFGLKIQIYLPLNSNETQLQLANQLQTGEVIHIFHNGINHFWGLEKKPFKPATQFPIIDKSRRESPRSDLKQSPKGMRVEGIDKEAMLSAKSNPQEEQKNLFDTMKFNQTNFSAKINSTDLKAETKRRGTVEESKTHVETITFHLTPPHSEKIVLLDVDDCLVMTNNLDNPHDGRYRYNTVLLSAFKKAKLTEIYLFTTYFLGNIAQNNEEEPISVPSPLKLKMDLESQGFKVKEVLTLFDVVYNQGIGAYYRDIIKPYESYVFSGGDLRQGTHQDAYKKACENEAKLRHEDGAQNLTKGTLFAYTKNQLQQSNNSHVFIFFDDRPEHLRLVTEANQQSDPSPLLTLIVKPEDEYSLRLMLNGIGNFEDAIKRGNEIIIANTNGKVIIFYKSRTDGKMRDFSCSEDLKNVLLPLPFDGNILAKNENWMKIYKRVYEEVASTGGCTPEDKEIYYTETLQSFIHYYDRWLTLKTQIESSPKVQGIPLAREKLGKRLNAIMPCNDTPLAFDARLHLVNDMFRSILENPAIEVRQFTSRLSPETLETEIRAIGVLEDNTAAQCKLYGYGETPIYVSETVAHQILSEDAEGKLVKENAKGNGYVKRVGEVFFKRGDINPNPLKPLAEAFVFYLSECLGGDIVSPTRLLVLEKRHGEKITVQASLAVGELGLDEVLRVPTGVEGLKHLFGEEILIQILPSLLQGTYYQDWLKKELTRLGEAEEKRKIFEQAVAAVPISRKEQMHIFQEVLFDMTRFPISHWPKDMQTSYQAHNRKLALKIEHWDGEDEASKQKYIFDEIARELWEGSALKGKPLLKLLSLLELYPNLTKNESLDNLVWLPELFDTLQLLYPNVKLDLLLSESQRILSLISEVHYSRHFLLTLLTKPGDAKGDNFRVRIQRNEAGIPILLEPIGIDNDDIFHESVVSSQNGYLINVKSVFYALQKHLLMPIHPDLNKSLSSREPTVMFLDVFLKVAKLQQYYERLMVTLYGQRAEARLEEVSFNQTFPRKFLAQFYQSLKDLSIQQKTAQSHTALLLVQEPILGPYYHALVIKHFPDNPQTLITCLYDKAEGYSLSEVLHDTIQANPRLLQSLNNTQIVTQHQYQMPLDFLEVFIKEGEKEGKLLGKNSEVQAKTLAAILSLNLPILFQQLRLSLSVFTALFIEYDKEFTCWLQKVDDTILLVWGANDCSPLRNCYLLHIFARLRCAEPPYTEISEKPWLLQALAAYGLELDAISPSDKRTSLHMAVRGACSLAVRTLIDLGAKTELLEGDNKTPLDLAIEEYCAPSDVKNIPYTKDAIESLIALGAGKALSVTNGLHYINYFSENSPAYCEVLLSLNMNLAWGLSLAQITQVQIPTRTPILLKGLGGLRYLKSDICTTILKGEDTFSKDNLYGRHNVTSIPVLITPKISLGVHLKENPEFLGREIMVHLLGKTLFGDVTPQVAFLKFTKKKTSLLGWVESETGYPVLATQTVPGNLTLQDILDEPQELAKIEPVSFAQVLLLTFLINPEDGRGDNYMLTPVFINGQHRYRLVPIDNDRAFVRPLDLNANGSSISGPKGLNVKTVLYCLNQMSLPLDFSVVQAFLVHEPYECLTNWLKAISIEQENINALFSKKEHEALQSAKINLQMVFRSSVVTDIYEKFICLQYALRDNPTISGMNLLCTAMPALGYRYQKAFNQFKVPQERFDDLTEGRFEKVVIQKTISDFFGQKKLKKITSTKSDYNKILDITGASIEQKSIKEQLWVKEEPSNPEIALEGLRKTYQERSQLAEIQAEILQGKYERFRDLGRHAQEAIINGQGVVLKGLDFSLMRNPNGSIDDIRQSAFLNLLSGCSFVSLRVNGCRMLNNQSLIKLLQGSKETLKALELKACSLSNDALLIINLQCPDLEKLSFIDLPFKEEINFVGNTFAALRVLSLEECVSIKTLQLNTPLLERLVVKNSNVALISTQSKALTSLKLIGCKEFSEKEIYRISKSFEKLTAVTIKDCPNILNATYYECYPILLSVSHQVFERSACDQFLNPNLLEIGGVGVRKINPLIGAVNIILHSIFDLLHKELQSRFGDNVGNIKKTKVFTEAVSRILSPAILSSLELEKIIIDSLDAAAAWIAHPNNEGSIVIACQFIQSRSRYLSFYKSVLQEKIVRGLLGISKEKFRDAAHQALMDWLKFVCKLSTEKTLAFECLLQIAKQDINTNIRKAVFWELARLVEYGFELSNEQLGMVWECLLQGGEATNGEVKQAAIEELAFLVKRRIIVPDKQLKTVWETCLFQWIKDANPKISQIATEELVNLSESGTLSSEYSHIVFATLLQGAWGENYWSRLVALQGLAKLINHGKLSEAELCMGFRQLLDGINNGEYDEIGKLFGRGLSLTEKQTQTMLDLLLQQRVKNIDNFRQRSIKVLPKLLMRDSNLTNEQWLIVFEELVQATKDTDWNVKQIAIEELSNLAIEELYILKYDFNVFHEKQRVVFERLLQGTTDTDSIIRKTAVEGLGKLLSHGFKLLDENSASMAFDCLLQSTKDGDWDVRNFAIQGLGRLLDYGSKLSAGQLDAVFQYLMQRVNDNGLHIRKLALEKLVQLVILDSRLFSGRLDTVLKCFLGVEKDLDSLKKAAIEGLVKLLGHCPRLSNEQLRMGFRWLLEQIEDAHVDVRRSTIEALVKLFENGFVPQEQLSAVSECLLEGTKDVNQQVKQAAIEGLAKWIKCGFTVSDGRLCTVSEYLLQGVKETDWKIRQAAIEGLAKWIEHGFMLSSHQLQALLQIDKNTDIGREIREDAIKVVAGLVKWRAGHDSNLSNEQLHMAWECLLQGSMSADLIIKRATMRELAGLFEHGSKLLDKQLWMVFECLLEGTKFDEDVAIEGLANWIEHASSRLSNEQLRMVWECLLQEEGAKGKNRSQQEQDRQAIVLKVLTHTCMKQFYDPFFLVQSFVEALEARLEPSENLTSKTTLLNINQNPVQSYTLADMQQQIYLLSSITKLSSSEQLYFSHTANCFLANTFSIEENFQEELDIAVSKILGKKDDFDWSVLPKRVILPFIQQKHWAAAILDCDYENLKFVLLWDSSVGERSFKRVLPIIDSVLGKLVQHYHGVFKCYTLMEITKDFSQQGLQKNTADDGPILLQNIEDMLKNPNIALTEFAKNDHLYTIKKFSSSDLICYKLYQSQLSSIRQKHRRLLVDSSFDTQLPKDALLFKYTNLPSSVESLVMEYCKEEVELAHTPLERGAELSSTIGTRNPANENANSYQLKAEQKLSS